MALALIEVAGLRAGTAAVVVVAVVVVVVVAVVAVVAVAAVAAAGRSAAVAVVAVAVAGRSVAVVAVTADREAADTADAPSNHSHGRMAAVSDAAPAILYRLLPAPPGGAGRI